MVLSRFEMLCGAAGDVKELEYISALHQTDTLQVRKDASIRAQDVRLFLMSRYGIEVTDEQVRDTIFEGLGGGSGDDECLDLMEVVAILLIPTIKKAVEQHKGVELPSGVLDTAPGMLDFVLQMILHDVTGNSAPKQLTPELVRSILVSYGEYDLALDDALMTEMVDATSADNEPSRSAEFLNVDAFANGLTSDLGLYDLRNETRLTTNMDDVFLTHHSEGSAVKTDSDGNHGLDEQATRELLATSTPLVRRRTVAAIDMTADTYRSKGLTVALWSTAVVTYFLYWSDFVDIDETCSDDYEYAYASGWNDNRAVFGCTVSTSVLRWLLFFSVMSCYGLFFVCLGSMGNSVYSKRVWMSVLGLFVVLMLSIGQGQLDSFSSKENGWLTIMSIVLGSITCGFHLAHIIVLLVPPERMASMSWLPVGTQYPEMIMKRAAAAKLATMTRNALDVVRRKTQNHVINTHYGQALKEYEKSGKVYVLSGGFQWAWKRMLHRSSFAEDGIWLPARVVASNIAQFVVAVYVLITGLNLTAEVSESYDTESVKRSAQDAIDRVYDNTVDEALVTSFVHNVSTIVAQFFASDSSPIDLGCAEFNETAGSILSTYCPETNGTLLCDTTAPINYLCPLVTKESIEMASQQALLQGSGLDVHFLTEATRAVLQQAAEESFDTLWPSQKYMVVIPMYVGTIVAFLIALYLAVSYIPSVTTTILKLRCGHIPSLMHPDFWRYRVAPDEVAMLTGSIFWGTVVSSIVVGAIVGFVVFLFLWQATVYFAQKLVALVLGILTIYLIRLTVLRTCRCKMYQAFYRQRPGAANLSLLALEWANLALSAGFVFLRMIKLLVAAGACIGKIDTPFLAPNVGRLGPIELDNYPTVHTKDVLSHEAHRHPYIEQLGVIYLMKLRYNVHFVKRASSCWRLIFVHALMPWLHSYRIQARPEQGQTRRLTLIENQHPTLKFVSLHNIYLNMDDPSDDDDDSNNHEGTGIVDNIEATYEGKANGSTLIESGVDEETGTDVVAAEINSDRMPPGTAPAVRTPTVRFASSNSLDEDEAVSYRQQIRNLQNEVEQLRAALAEASPKKKDDEFQPGTIIEV